MRLLRLGVFGRVGVFSIVWGGLSLAFRSDAWTDSRGYFSGLIAGGVLLVVVDVLWRRRRARSERSAPE